MSPDKPASQTEALNRLIRFTNSHRLFADASGNPCEPEQAVGSVALFPPHDFVSFDQERELYQQAFEKHDE